MRRLKEAAVRSGKRATLAVVAVCAATFTFACSGHWNSNPSAVFFPLKPRMMWMYRVHSASQQANYTVTDMVVGSEYVPALKVTGDVVQEFYNLDRAGLRPIVYTEAGGYLTRFSGLDYVAHEIKGPIWGRSIEEDFLPMHLVPDQAWSNKLFPYGRLPGAFQVVESHKSFREMAEIVVPAGHFKDCIRIETLANYVGGPYRNRPLKLGYRDWYAPNVGLIKTVAYQGGANGPAMDEVELIRFDAGTKADASEPRKNS